MISDPDAQSHGLTRRTLVARGVAGASMLSAGGWLAACGGTAKPATVAPSTLRRGGVLRVGATGGGAKDTLDAHVPGDDPDAMRVSNLYEPLCQRSPDMETMQMLVAESLEPEHGKADVWVARIKDGLEFHDGQSVSADDVIFSLRRILDPHDPKVGAANIGYVDAQKLTKLDRRTIRIPLKAPNIAFPDDVGQYFNGIVPVGYDPKRPIGSGPFKFKSFTPGQQSAFTRFEHYRQADRPYVHTLIIIDFTDDTARVNALLGGQVHAIDNLPAAQLATVAGNANLKPLIAQTGGWSPFVMRTDQPPFTDPRVREAFKYIVDRKQMVEQVLSGQGRIANDLYSPYDADYDSGLPQRDQDLDRAKHLLRQAGQSDLHIELVTSPVYQGIVQGAQVFAQQASQAGVKVTVRQVDTGTFYGSDYLQRTFTQDFWNTRTYLAQVAQCNLPSSPYNETHWSPSAFQKLIMEGRAELNSAKRKDILAAAQAIQYNQDGYIVPFFANQVDAYSSKLGGLKPARSGFPLGNYWLKNVGFA